VQTQGRRQLVFSVKGIHTPGPPVRANTVQLRVRVLGETASYLYSLDGGRSFSPLGQPVKLAFSWWKGARPALFAFSTSLAGTSAGNRESDYVDFDWAHYRALSSPDDGSIITAVPRSSRE